MNKNAAQTGRLLLKFLTQFSEDQIPFLAAGLCYFITFSIFPLLLVLAALAGFFLTYDEANRQTIEYARHAFPHQSDLVTDVLRTVRQHHQGASLFGLLALLWSGKNIFGALAHAMNQIWGVSSRSWLSENLRATAAALSIGFCLLVISVVTTAVTAWTVWGTSWLPPSLAKYPPVALGQAATLGPFLTATLTLTVLYHWLPNTRVPWKVCGLSAALVALAWEGIRHLFGWYLKHIAAFDAIYGSLGSALGFMLWIYISAILILSGVEIAKLAHQEHRPIP
ncbi:MAG: YihY/virulence factor BrkB family protein [Candidatus Sericytochromatia bacterium]|nr:YihY/virulence factor BrkB family protein [Candidatus Sericytochromatia bacterium]